MTGLAPRIVGVSHSRGHRVTCDETGVWRYEDGAICDDSRACVRCQRMHANPGHPGQGGPDPCLGWLPGVDFACCGHGDPRYQYVCAEGVRYGSLAEWRVATR